MLKKTVRVRDNLLIPTTRLSRKHERGGEADKHTRGVYSHLSNQPGQVSLYVYSHLSNQPGQVICL